VYSTILFSIVVPMPESFVALPSRASWATGTAASRILVAALR
jgi:hypothetical protein